MMFFNRFGQQGLIDGYWSIDTYSLNLKPGLEYIYTMKKSVFKFLNINGNCMEDKLVEMKQYNQLECIENYSQELLQRKLKEKGHKLCWIPQADYFIRLMNISDMEACQTTKEIDDLNNALQYTMDRSRRKESGCLKPCTVPTITTKLVENMVPTVKGHPRANFSYMYLEWEDDHVLNEEEYLLMDGNAIIANIGGSLGLFLGFSCLAFVRLLLDGLQFLLLKFTKMDA